MFDMVTKKMGQEAIVVDADDLLQHPGIYFHILFVNDNDQC